MGQLEEIQRHGDSFLEDGEELLFALTAAPRGRTTAVAGGGIAGMIGDKMVSGVHKKGENVGLRVESNMVVAITPQRLLTLKVGISAMGKVTAVKEVMSSIPLSEVDSVEAKRMGLGGTLSLGVRGGAPVKLECQVGRARQLVDAFNETRTAG
jgi:hypothetical protein